MNVTAFNPDSPFAGAIGAAAMSAFRHEKLARLGGQQLAAGLKPAYRRKPSWPCSSMTTAPRACVPVSRVPERGDHRRQPDLRDRSGQVLRCVGAFDEPQCKLCPADCIRIAGLPRIAGRTAGQVRQPALIHRRRGRWRPSAQSSLRETQ